MDRLSRHAVLGAQELLRITRVPEGASQALIGRTLLEAGQLTVAGTYDCEIPVAGAADVEVHLKPSQVSGSITPAVAALRANRTAVKVAASGAAAFVAGTLQTLSLTGLKGEQIVRVRFTVPASGSITFAEGADRANPAAIAEYNAL